MSKVKALTGAEAVAEAMRQINPDVVPAYPITPQTNIMEKFASFVADGAVDSEIIRVESEHSAMSAAVGASAAGARVMTATSSAGLALMWEIVGVASGSRLPIVMNVVNRALSAPINIHCDHSDAMGARDLSWIQVYSEDAQEAYEHTLLGIRLAEHPDIQLPVMVNQDGFITSHCVQNVKIMEDAEVRNFVGERKPIKALLNVEDPITVGPLQLQDYYFETKRQQVDAIQKSMQAFLEIGKELSKLTGKEYGLTEQYHLDDADVAIVVLNSTAGTVKAVVDKMRKEGKKVGLLKIRMYRPFPYEEVSRLLNGKKAIAVLDRSESFGANPPVYGEVRAALYDSEQRPRLHSFVFGLGGRDIFEHDIEDLYNKLLTDKVTGERSYIGVRE